MYGWLMVLLLCGGLQVRAQQGTYRYSDGPASNGSVFYALNGSTGQLRFMLDNGEQSGQWQVYGSPIRETGENSLSLATVTIEHGVLFYAIESRTGQLYYMNDFGPAAGQWAPYGGVIRTEGDPTLALRAASWDQGTRFTAMDNNTGAIYYMFDYGETAGQWMRYGELIQR